MNSTHIKLQNTPSSPNSYSNVDSNQPTASKLVPTVGSTS